VEATSEPLRMSQLGSDSRILREFVASQFRDGQGDKSVGAH
jgi:hypothetical protein